MSDGTLRGESKERVVRWRRRVGISVVGVGGLLALGLFVWIVRAESRVAALMAEYRQRGEPVTLADLIRPPVPDEQNAALDLTAAARAIDLGSEDWAALDARDFEWGLPMTDEHRALLRRLVESNTEALAHVEAAMEKGGVDWQVDYDAPLGEVRLPHLNEQRPLVTLLRVAAYDAHLEGRDDSALEHVRQIMFVADAIDQGHLLVEHLSAVGSRFAALHALGDLTPELQIGAGPPHASRGQIASLIENLLNEQFARRALHDALTGERVSATDEIERLRRGDDLDSKISLQALGRWFQRGYLADSKRAFNRHITAVRDAAAAPTQAEFEQRVGPVLDQLSNPDLSEFLVSIMAPPLTGAVDLGYKHLAERRMAAAALAVRWYVVEHGELPESLEALAPEYLPDVPDDPFDPAGGAIRYVADPERPILYSVGENGIDNGGSETPRRTGLRRPDRWNMEDGVMHLSRRPREEEE